jgi:hypothetical protein
MPITANIIHTMKHTVNDSVLIPTTDQALYSCVAMISLPDCADCVMAREYSRTHAGNILLKEGVMQGKELVLLARVVALQTCCLHPAGAIRLSLVAGTTRQHYQSCPWCIHAPVAQVLPGRSIASHSSPIATGSRNVLHFRGRKYHGIKKLYHADFGREHATEIA